MSSSLHAQRQVRIAFGSCGSQDHALPIFDVVRKHKPDFFVFLGDNIYGDTHSMDTLKAKYGRLGANPGFKRLKQETKVLATWDDHDYGWNDVGRHYPEKEQSKKIFLDFFNEPISSERRTRPGIYASQTYQFKGGSVQMILLDNRTFRDDLLAWQAGMKKESKYFYDLDYIPHTSPDSTFLGEAQWAWLEQELLKPASVRLICSGSQFGIEYNGYEAWANFPHEQKRMLELIKKTKAEGVVFLSGDVHYAEISHIKEPDLYPIYDITSSGLSSTWLFPTPNKNRIEGPIMENHFGLITIDFKKKKLLMEIFDIHDNQRIEYEVGLKELGRK
jgi:alkaline phosphatase D